jgi:hypothetical protein
MRRAVAAQVHVVEATEQLETTRSRGAARALRRCGP